MLAKTLQEMKNKLKSSYDEKLALREKLVAGVAHELNNPLMIVMGNTQLLLHSQDTDEAQREKPQRLAVELERSRQRVEAVQISAANSRTCSSEITGQTGIFPRDYFLTYFFSALGPTSAP